MYPFMKEIGKLGDIKRYAIFRALIIVFRYKDVWGRKCFILADSDVFTW